MHHACESKVFKFVSMPRHSFGGAFNSHEMKQISTKQSKRLREFTAIKRKLSQQCIICGNQAVDGAHLLPRSLFPEYYTKEWNIVPMCRYCHNRYDNDLSFRQEQTRLYNRVKENDPQAAYKYFKI